VSVKALHDAARRYLLERQGGLAEEHRPTERPIAQMPPDEARKALAGWAAFRADQELLLAIERTMPSEFASVDAVRAFIGRIAQVAPKPNQPGDAERVQLDAADEERRRFIAYVEGLSDTAAESLLPMPHRRVLTTNQRRSIFRRLRKQWPPRERPLDFWHPYDALTTDEVLHLQTAWFDVTVPMEDLRSRVSAHTGDHLWQLNEGSRGWDSDDAWQVDYELSPLLFWPGGGHETLWTWRGMDFLIYTDHNLGTYFLGAWVIRQVQDLWPDWQAHRWTGVVYDHPPRPWPWLFPPWAWPPGPRG